MVSGVFCGVGLRGMFGFLCIGGFELVAGRDVLKILVFVGAMVMSGDTWFLVLYVLGFCGGHGFPVYFGSV